MRNKKRRRKIFMGPCTKPVYTAKGFHFRVFHKPNEFSINSSFYQLFVWPVFHFGPRYSNETKRPKRNNKTTRATTHHEKPYKRCLQVMICYKKKWSLLSAMCYNYLKLVINSGYFQSAIFLSQTSYILMLSLVLKMYIVLCSFPFFNFWFPFYVNQNKSVKLKKYEIGFSLWRNSPILW